MKKIKAIFWLIVLVVITSCAVGQPRLINADFYVSDVTEQGISCVKQHCRISIEETEISFLSDNHGLIINSFSWAKFSTATGVDQDNKSWDVIVGNMRREPYLMLLRSDSLAILIGYECYKQ